MPQAQLITSLSLGGLSIQPPPVTRTFDHPNPYSVTLPAAKALTDWAKTDANTAGAMYPDQSLYPANAGPELARKINRTLQRADQIEHSEGGTKRDWFVPIVADAEAGFGGPLNCFEIMKAYIEAGAAGVHFEDQLASEKKCGHLGGKVLIPTQAHIRNLNAARLAADVTIGV